MMERMLIVGLDTEIQQNVVYTPGNAVESIARTYHLTVYVNDTDAYHEAVSCLNNNTPLDIGDGFEWTVTQVNWTQEMPHSPECENAKFVVRAVRDVTTRYSGGKKIQ